MAVPMGRRVCQQPGCNVIFDAPLVGEADYCREHRRSNYQPVERETGKRREMPPRNPWTITDSPTGDFVGVDFMQLDFLTTLWMGSFDTGTIVQHGGKAYRVDGCELQTGPHHYTVIMAGASPYLKELK